MDAHSLSLASILVDADKLRISTFKELMAILTPFQGVDLLVSIKKLHLSMHEWGKTKDLQAFVFYSVAGVVFDKLGVLRWCMVVGGGRRMVELLMDEDQERCRRRRRPRAREAGDVPLFL
ncbi:UNVERIFIED_CONTAM: protein DOG1-like 1 [Sesamum angustifolium]|uniref:Protein DOG1-like 1 n=1 Tax=Sesamum angustifolium TaxID=2727405 RepID=A0AAW2PCM2_9LAMI